MDGMLNKYERINVNFVTEEEIQLLHLMKSEASKQGQKMRFWIMELIREKLEREGALPDKKKK